MNASLKVDSLTAKPFRSGWALFDILFRSNLKGSINRQPVLVTSQVIDGGRQTRWQAEKLPVGLVSPYLKGPFLWIEEGTVDIDVEDRWSVNGKADIEMHWSFIFHDLKAEVPQDAAKTTKVFAVPIVDCSIVLQNAYRWNLVW